MSRCRSCNLRIRDSGCRGFSRLAGPARMYRRLYRRRIRHHRDCRLTRHSRRSEASAREARRRTLACCRGRGGLSRRTPGTKSPPLFREPQSYNDSLAFMAPKVPGSPSLSCCSHTSAALLPGSRLCGPSAFAQGGAPYFTTTREHRDLPTGKSTLPTCRSSLVTRLFLMLPISISTSESAIESNLLMKTPGFVFKIPAHQVWPGTVEPGSDWRFHDAGPDSYRFPSSRNCS